MIIPISDLMRTSDVKRWHIVNTTKDQTLAEHHALVAGIARHLLCAICTPTLAEIAVLLDSALLHDIGEVHAGDIPSPLKHEPFPNNKIAGLIKIADSIEAYWWIYNNGVGSRKGEVVMDNFVRLMRRAQDYEVIHDHKIIPAVNAVLLELSLPFVIHGQG